MAAAPATESRPRSPAESVAAGIPLDPLTTHRVAKLAVPVEWMRFCWQCDSEQRFVADRVCVSGLLGCCTHCGDERIAPFTRMNSEVG